MADFEIVGTGNFIFVMKGKERMRGPFANYDMAKRSRDALRRKAKRVERKCIGCSDPFFSEGPHNRMCDACRANPDRIIELAWSRAA